MRIAVASSGLGHVRRGIEAWAEALATGLHASGEDVVLFHGGGKYACPGVALPFIRRDSALLRRLERHAPRFTWRWGLKSSYVLEQRSFARALLRVLRREAFDVVHTQDVALATILERERVRGGLAARTILAHGTDESPDVLARFRYLQHLSPERMESAERGTLLRRGFGGQARNAERGRGKRMEFCIPNFVDTTRFCPAEHGPERGTTAEIRAKFDVPRDAFVIGGSAALRIGHKRMDVLISEVAKLPRNVQRPTFNVQRSSAPLCLFLAGAATPETPAVERLAAETLGERCRILKNLPMEQMPDFYRALDLFVHPALEEVFGICFLEAMACGVPVVSHDSPTGRWIVGERGAGSAEPGKERGEGGVASGEGGWCVDMRKEGFLERAWPAIAEEYAAKQAATRPHVERTFSWQAVYPRFMEMYRAVCGD